MDIGSRIRRRREQRGLSQTDLANILGYSDRSAIAKIESGRSNLTQSKIEAFASALHTTPEYILGWTNDPYDYDLDEDGVMDEIPPSQLRALIEAYDGNMTDVWHAWLDIEAGIGQEHAQRFFSRDDLRFALWGADDNMDDDDLKAVLDYAEYIQQKKNKDK